MDEAKVREAVRWIVNLLESQGTRFQLTAGLAARAYGSPRPLTDIDFDVETGTFDKIMPSVGKNVVFGPGQKETEDWSNFLLTLNYNGVLINLSETATRIFDREESTWTDWPIDFDTARRMEVLGVTIPVISRERLIAYKKVLAREQDMIDIMAMEKGS